MIILEHEGPSNMRVGLEFEDSEGLTKKLVKLKNRAPKGKEFLVMLSNNKKCTVFLLDSETRASEEVFSFDNEWYKKNLENFVSKLVAEIFENINLLSSDPYQILINNVNI